LERVTEDEIHFPDNDYNSGNDNDPDDDAADSGQDNDDDVCLNDLGRQPSKLNYSCLLARHTELCRAIANDQEYLASSLSSVNMMIQRVCKKRSIDVTFDIDPLDLEVNEEKDNKQPLPAIAKPITGPASRMKRMQSSVERGKKASKKRRHKAPSKLYTSNEGDILAPPKSKKRNCSYCRKSGHHINTCPSLLMYSKPPLPMNDRIVREVLAQDMLHPDKYTTFLRDAGDNRNIVRSFPVGVQGVVIHRRLLITSNVVQVNSIENMCLECTVLKDGCVSELFTKVLFRVPAVNAYVNRGKTNIVICELDSCSSIAFNGQSSNNAGTGNRASMTQEMAMLNSGMLQFSQDTSGLENMGYGIPMDTWR
jgi:hypothetical protein